MRLVRVVILSLLSDLCFISIAFGATDVKVLTVPLAPLAITACSNDGALRQSDVVNRTIHTLRSYTVEWKVYDDKNKVLGGAGLEYQLDTPLASGDSGSYSQTVTLTRLGVTGGNVGHYTYRIIGASFSDGKKWALGKVWKEALLPPASASGAGSGAVEPAAKHLHRDSPVVVTAMGVQEAGDTWTSCLIFENVSTRIIRAVQFQLTYYDAFDAPLTSFQPDSVGEFRPGVLIEPGYVNGDKTKPPEGCWDAPVVAGSLSRVTAEVLKARFEDDEIFDASADADRTVFTGRYLGTFEDHPVKIKCAFGLTFDWEYAHSVPACAGYIRKWLAAHPPLIDLIKSVAYGSMPPPSPAPARRTAPPPDVRSPSPAAKGEGVCALLSPAVAARALGGPAQASLLRTGQCSWDVYEPRHTSLTYEISPGKVRAGSGVQAVSGVGDAAYFAPIVHVLSASRHGNSVNVWMINESGVLIGDAETMAPVARDILRHF